jgi:hypothetical protein
MKNIKKYLVVAAAMAVFGSCELYKLPELPKPTAGTAGLDLTKMVSVGNSLTAGFMNGALYTVGQANSYPNIIAAQMAQTGGGAFNQPDINSTNGFFGTAGPTILGRLRLKLVNGAPTPTPQLPGDLPAPFAGNKAALNNFGVPGVTLGTAQTPLLGGPSTGNPAFNALYARFASNPGTSTLIGDAAAALGNGGTFFTFWLGNNDVLGYATGGASNPAILTSPSDFTQRLGTALNAMLNAKADAEGAVANIPNVTNIPFFTTVPVNPVNLPAANAAALNGAFAGYNQLCDVLKGAPFNVPSAEMDARKISFTAGAGNRVVISDETARDLGPLWDLLVAANQLSPASRAALEPYRRARQAIISTANVTGDLIVLPAASFIGTTVGGNPQAVNGLSVPLADNWVLIPSERTEVQNAINNFNQAIAAAVTANSSRLVLVDMNTAFQQIAAGTVTVNGSGITASLTPPFGAFSLDGVHPNARGAAYIANLFISAINEKWGSTIPLCNPNNYSSNELPSP